MITKGKIFILEKEKDAPHSYYIVNPKTDEIIELIDYQVIEDHLGITLKPGEKVKVRLEVIKKDRRS